jgi:hypothetical protein
MGGGAHCAGIFFLIKHFDKIYVEKLKDFFQNYNILCNIFIRQHGWRGSNIHFVVVVVGSLLMKRTLGGALKDNWYFKYQLVLQFANWR